MPLGPLDVALPAQRRARRPLPQWADGLERARPAAEAALVREPHGEGAGAVKVTDPVPFFGYDSGMRRVTVTQREAATLRAAAAILSDVHDIVTDHLGDGHFDADGLTFLCGGGNDLIRLADGEVEW
jgi:hypothetical protein